MTVAWDPEFAERAPPFAPLRAAARELRGPALPACADLNRLLAARRAPVVNASGRDLRFIEQLARPAAFEEKYEPRIFLRGEVQFRASGWHDVFNALVWLTFPRAKAALNQRHYRALERQHADGLRNRGPAQDALTLLDESGVLVATSDAMLGGLLAKHAWKDLFWYRRAAVAQHMRFYVFGHGVYEKMLQPFIGLTARAMLYEVPVTFMALPLDCQLEELDARLATRVGDAANPLATRDLTPVPLLGIPGWCPDNEQERYYDNTGYFRPPPAAAIRGRR